MPTAPKRENALRHSFISYHLAAVQNTAQVALEARNSLPPLPGLGAASGSGEVVCCHAGLCQDGESGQRSEAEGEDVFREVRGDDVGVEGDGFDPGSNDGCAHKSDLATKERKGRKGIEIVERPVSAKHARTGLAANCCKLCNS